MTVIDNVELESVRRYPEMMKIDVIMQDIQLMKSVDDLPDIVPALSALLIPSDIIRQPNTPILSTKSEPLWIPI